MPGVLDGRVALITGAGSGIGRAAAVAFAEAGASVAIVDRGLAAAEETAALILPLISAGRPRVITIQADIASDEDTERMVAVTVAELGGLDCAFNNAGIAGGEVNSIGRRLADVERQAWDRIIAVNLTGTWLCMKAELAVMQAAGRGAIVNNASTAGLVGMAGSSAYVASKHGIVGMTRAAALEYAAHGIRINALCPGYTQTALMKTASADKLAAVETTLPMKRFGQAGEIAALALWLCSDQASYVTGAAYAVDGGLTAG